LEELSMPTESVIIFATKEKIPIQKYLERDEEIIWVCNCGCTDFNFTNFHELKCVKCGEIQIF
jgi:hypothetical protein